MLKAMPMPTICSSSMPCHVGRRRRVCAAVAALLCLGSAMARSAELKVLSAGAYEPVVAALAPEFERQTGHHIILSKDTAGALVRRIGAGEAFDVAIVTPAAVAQLAPSGRLASGPGLPLAKVGIGVAVRQGAPAPDIGSVAAFRRALLGARAVAYIDPQAGGSSGVYLAQLFVTLGVADEVRAKAVLVPGGLVAERLVHGEADLAIHQVSEILAVPGVTLVGKLPAEIQNYTVYVGVRANAAHELAAAQALMDLLASPRARALMTQRGMEAP